MACSGCGNALTSCWSKSSTGKKHPYYLCHTKGCASYGKSIRRDKIEGEFAALLRSMRQHASVTRLVETMVKQAWAQQAQYLKSDLQKTIKTIEAQIDDLMDRLVEASSQLTSKAYERKIEKLEKQRLLAADQMAKSVEPKATRHQMLELSLK